MKEAASTSATGALTIRVPLRIRRPDDELPVERALPPRRSRLKDAGRPARVAVLLATAHRFDEMLRSGAIASMEQLARRLGVTRARVSQILMLTLLAPDVQNAVLALKREEGENRRVTEVDLRRMVAESDWSVQRRLASSRGLAVGSGAPLIET